MPLGIVSDSEFKKELENAKPKNDNGNGTGMPGRGESDGQVKDIERGRGKGNTEVPDGIRNLIADEVIMSGRQSGLDLARHLGSISPSSVSAYTAGAHSTATFRETPNLPAVNKAKERLAKMARRRLGFALSGLTREKIEGESAKNIASIAKDMSAVVRNMEPEKLTGPVGGGNSGPTFIIYSPRIRQEDSFEVIQAGE